MPSKPKLIVFDLFGTLIRFGVKGTRTAKSSPEPKRMVVGPVLTTKDFPPEAVFKQLDISPPPGLLERVRTDITEELESLTLFDDVEATLNSASQRLAACSNLDQPYEDVVDRLLSQFDLIRCLSYQVGCIKPEDEIYDWLVRESGVPKEEVVFVGDNLVADYED